MDKNYIIVGAACCSQLQEKVNKKIEEGYQPFGSLTLIHDAICQPMIENYVLEVKQQTNSFDFGPR